MFPAKSTTTSIIALQSKIIVTERDTKRIPINKFQPMLQLQRLPRSIIILHIRRSRKHLITIMQLREPERYSSPVILARIVALVCIHLSCLIRESGRTMSAKANPNVRKQKINKRKLQTSAFASLVASFQRVSGVRNCSWSEFFFLHARCIRSAASAWLCVLSGSSGLLPWVSVVEDIACVRRGRWK